MNNKTKNKNESFGHVKRVEVKDGKIEIEVKFTKQDRENFKNTVTYQKMLLAILTRLVGYQFLKCLFAFFPVMVAEYDRRIALLEKEKNHIEKYPEAIFTQGYVFDPNRVFDRNGDTIDLHEWDASKYKPVKSGGKNEKI